MKMPTYIAMMSRLRPVIRRFGNDRRGLAALEFALIVPLMFAFFFGMIEVTNGFTIYRKIAVVARTLSDLTSRAKTASVQEISNFFTVGKAIMQPYPDVELIATISEIYIDPNTSVGRVQWSQTQGGKAKKTGDPVPVPTGLIAKDKDGKTLANQYLILSEVAYKYTPAVGYFMNKTGITLSDSTFTRPRQDACVYYPDKTASCPTN